MKRLRIFRRGRLGKATENRKITPMLQRAKTSLRNLILENRFARRLRQGKRKEPAPEKA